MNPAFFSFGTNATPPRGIIDPMLLAKGRLCGEASAVKAPAKTTRSKIVRKEYMIKSFQSTKVIDFLKNMKKIRVSTTQFVKEFFNEEKDLASSRVS
mmetsp:Transcript_672/g.1020  ORF Transcript_672/g.1020 Transcript_672/m.1020 type:complete len:97 (+) Transcript_672:1-291(+)